MGHSLQAFVARRSVAERIARSVAHAKLVPLNDAFALIPLTDALVDAMNDGTARVISPFFKLDQRTLDAVLSAAEGEIVGYLETEYFGGTGEQTAGAWSKSETRVAPMKRADSINVMLREVGVVAGPSLDEFETIGLGQFRKMDDFD